LFLSLLPPPAVAPTCSGLAMGGVPVSSPALAVFGINVDTGHAVSASCGSRLNVGNSAVWSPAPAAALPYSAVQYLCLYGERVYGGQQQDSVQDQ
jgi:hypothetical protein